MRQLPGRYITMQRIRKSLPGRLSPTTMTALMLLSLLSVSILAAENIVDNPDKLTFEELDYRPPAPKDFRQQLQCGATAYIAENHEIPTFDLTVIVGTGSIYVPVEKAGLADMTGYLMRNGGFEGMTAHELDERVEFLAGEISVSIGTSRGTAKLFCLAKDIDEGMELLKGVLRYPAFDQEALDHYRSDVLSTLRQRNNQSSSIEQREWQFLLYGDHPSTVSLRRTEASINSITRDDMLAFHDKYFFPGNFTLALSGDFDTGEIIDKLDTMLAGWPNHDLTLPEVTDQIPDTEPGVYMIDKKDVNQSRITLGHMGVKRDNPDEFAIRVMNDVLGGGGFTSRIVRRVRSDEGLAYNAGSRFTEPVLYPGMFRCWFQTKHATAALGTRIILEEIERIRSETIDEDELETSKSSFISDLVNPFSSSKAIVNTFASDDYTGRPDDYWQKYEERMNAVTADDVLRAAKRYLRPDELLFLVVGDIDAVRKGIEKDPARFSDFGKMTILPLRDPLTLEYPRRSPKPPGE